MDQVPAPASNRPATHKPAVSAPSSGVPQAKRRVTVWVSGNASPHGLRERDRRKPRNFRFWEDLGGLRAGRTRRHRVPSSQPQPRRLTLPPWLQRLSWLALWAGIGSTVLASGWYGFWLVINPGSVGWLSGVFPEWSREAALHQDQGPKSLTQLEAEAIEQGFALGDPLPLSGPDDATAPLLIPVFSNASNCVYALGCGRLEELRVYKPEASRLGTVYRLGDRLSVQGPDEFFVTAPLVSRSSQMGSSRRLPLDAILSFDGAPPNHGDWFLLRGTDTRGGNRLLYGHVGRYDPHREKLELLLPWTSPTRQLPQWRAVSSSGLPELFIDQTVGLEPRFLVHQVRGMDGVGNPITMQPLSLQQTALKHNSYESGLVLARSGLWSPALAVMTIAKERVGDRWTPLAQQQMELIALHAAFTKAQADTDWASPAQQITALVYDGRWEVAWQALLNAIRQGYNADHLLQSDDAAIWQRVQAAVRVSPGRTEVRLWGGLMAYARQGREEAIAWLQTQLPSRGNASGTTTAQLDQILQQLDDTPIGSDRLPNNASQFYGSASPVNTITASDWLVPQADSWPTAAANQQWYEIQVEEWHDGDAWGRSPFAALSAPGSTPRYLWHRLGLAANATVQLVTWQPGAGAATQQAQVHGMRVQAGQLTLLALGNAQPDVTAAPALLAIAPNTLSLRPVQALTLNTLAQQQTQQASQLVFSLVQELRRTGDLDLSRSQPHEILQVLGTWMVDYVDLTGDGELEALVRGQLLPASMPPTLTALEADVTEVNAAPIPSSYRTYIVRNDGKLLYSEAADRTPTLQAIATRSHTPTPTLLVQQGDRYRLLHWSDSRQRFE